MSMHKPGDLPLKHILQPLLHATRDRSPAPSLLVAIAGMAGFALIAIAVVSHAGIASTDLRFACEVHAHRCAGLIHTMPIMSAINGVLVIGLTTIALALWLQRKRLRRWLETVLLAVPGVLLLNLLLKQVFVRPEPHFVDPWSSLTSYSFPSGHVLQSTVFYGLLTALLIAGPWRKSSRLLITAATSSMVIRVAARRVYLGAHYLTDVVAALLEGVAWLLLCRVAMVWPQRRNEIPGASQ